jgi:hypothetical protein
MRKVMFFPLMAVLVMFSASAFADTVVGTGSGGWQTWVPSNVDQNRSPYWDGNSYDSGSSYNIGNYLTNTGGFTGGSGPGSAYQYWGTATGGSDPFGFDWISGSSQGALKLEVAGFAPENIFGYYDADGLHPIFGGSATAGASTIFTPTGDYGFYLTSPQGTFRTGMTGVDDLYQHFAIFREAPGAYWIGMEDLKTGSDFDYNDMVVRVSSVPEPATMMLLGFGLVGLAGFRRKYQK